MTVIVTDGVTIAWDAQLTVDGQKLVSPRHKVEYVRGRLYALAGDGPDAAWMSRWYTKGCPQNSIPPGEWVMMIIEKNGDLIFVSKHAPYPAPLSYPFGIGSGSIGAMGAIVVGADAVKAACAAAKVDTDCCGPVYGINIVEALKGPWKGNRLPTEYDVDETLGEIRGRK